MSSVLLCIIIVHIICTLIQWAVRTRSTGSGFDLAWLSCLPSVCVFGVLGAICRKFFITSFSLPFSVLSLWDWPLTWKTIILQCYYTVGWVIRPVKSVSEMTYNVSSGTLNPTIPYHTSSVNISKYDNLLYNIVDYCDVTSSCLWRTSD